MEIELPYDPAIPLLGIHTKESRIERDMCTPMFFTALFTISMVRGHTQSSWSYQEPPEMVAWPDLCVPQSPPL